MSKTRPALRDARDYYYSTNVEHEPRRSPYFIRRCRLHDCGERKHGIAMQYIPATSPRQMARLVDYHGAMQISDKPAYVRFNISTPLDEFGDDKKIRPIKKPLAVQCLWFTSVPSITEIPTSRSWKSTNERRRFAIMTQRQSLTLSKTFRRRGYRGWSRRNSETWDSYTMKP